MRNGDVSRRKFLGRAGSVALAVPLAATAVEVMSSRGVEAAMEEDDRQPIPNRSLTSRSRGTGAATASMPTDGSDCSSAINNAITSRGSAGGVVTIPWHDTGGNQCVYMLDIMANTYVGTKNTAHYGVLLQSNILIQADPGVIIKAMPDDNGNGIPVSYDRAYMFYGMNVSNVEIANINLVGERYTHDYSGTSTDEWCHGLQLLGVQHVTVRASSFSCCTGDGICIGDIGSASPLDVVICDVVSTGNRRQALSITSGDTIQVYDSEFSNTYGTAPMDGIDIEPEGSATVSNVTIENCIIRGNSGDGIQINSNGTSTSVTNVAIKNCLIAYNYWHGFIAQGSGAATTGTFYGNAVYQNGSVGISLGDVATKYTVGAVASGGNYSNNFSNNNVGTYSYPHNSTSNINGYIDGNDMHFSATALSSGANNVVQYNTYHT